jgi:uncharacterized membrane protein YkoI
MFKLLGGVGAVAVLGLLLAATVSWAADEKKVPLNKIPAKVMAAIKARFPGAKITSAEKENESGKVIYDIELTHKGLKYEMDIQEDGTVVEIEKEIPSKDVPEVVTTALKKKYPKATVKIVMEVNKVKGKKETPDHYEVTLETADKKEMEVTVSLDGKTVKAEKEEKKKE